MAGDSLQWHLPWDIDPATLDISKHLVAFLVCGVLTLGTCISSYIGIVRHLRAGGKKGTCIYTVRILLMAPSYSVTSFLALIGRLTELNLVLELGRKFYECIVIFAFTQLLVAQLGGFDRLGDLLTDDDCVHMPPVRWVFDKYSWTPAKRFVRRSLSSILQYAAVTLFIIPCALVSSLISPWFFQHILGPLSSGATGASQILAMYGLIVFYHANHETLAPIRPVQKLISIKLLLIATIWQTFIIHGLAKFTNIFDHLAEHSEGKFSSEQISDGTINALIVVEMFILSSYHHCVFPPGEDLSRISPPHAGTAPSRQVTGGSEMELSEEASTPTAAHAAEAGVAPTEADEAEAATQSATIRRVQLWVGSDHWGSHVDGNQTQLTGCHANCPTIRRFYHVFDITDIWKFYRELRKNYRTVSTDNLDVSNAPRYAMGFFAGRHALRRDQEQIAAPLAVPLAPPPS